MLTLWPNLLGWPAVLVAAGTLRRGQRLVGNSGDESMNAQRVILILDRGSTLIK